MKSLKYIFLFIIIFLLSYCSKEQEKIINIKKTIVFSFFLSTIAPDLHPLPSITCSFARTVSSTGSQFT